MNCIDCENYFTALESVSKVFGISTNDIEYYFKSVDYISMFEYKEVYRIKDFSQYIYDSFVKHFKVVPRDICVVYWFHLSRTMNPELFEQKGILPLNKALPLIFPEITRTHCYDVFREGPFAILVKDAAFHPNEMGNHDYLRVPEVIQDMGLEEDFMQKSVSVIVKFWTEVDFPSDFYLKPILNYIYYTIHHMDFSLDCNTCFDARNRIIEPNRIMYVEQLKESTNAYA